MIPAGFPQANSTFGPPSDMDESQVRSIRAYRGKVSGGIHDGQSVVVVNWQPLPSEIAAIMDGSGIYITMFGGLAPHMLTTDFNQATHPA